MKIGIANDHSAVDMKKQVVEYLVEKGYEVVNYGTDSYESCPYPKYGEKIGKAVADGEVDLGVAICGTGLGISMAANKVHGVRAAVCSEPYTAKMAREHNNANVIAFGARVIGIEMAKISWCRVPWGTSPGSCRYDYGDRRKSIARMKNNKSG